MDKKQLKTLIFNILMQAKQDVTKEFDVDKIADEILAMPDKVTLDRQIKLIRGQIDWYADSKRNTFFVNEYEEYHAILQSLESLRK